MLYYLVRKPYYSGENRAMPPRLRYSVYFLYMYFKMYSASRGLLRDSTASSQMFLEKLKVEMVAELS